jgi:cellulose synthase/poly-beta-1,6-N-acetylglucosamine synthase-like glycosyltransferase
MTDPFYTAFLFPVLIVVLGSYALFTAALIYFWVKLPSNYSKKKNAQVRISVIIPVRNEVDNIGNLLADLSKQTYDHSQFEVLVVDDSSVDGTLELVQEFATSTSINLRAIALTETTTTSPKKRAIEAAMSWATGELIMTTDGDCRVGTAWLETFAAAYANTQAKLISGPVTFTSESTLTDHLQTVEFASLIGSGASSISAGFPSMCNGANLAYPKSAFEAVNGYDGVRHIASGDDEFLMHKIAARYAGSVHFLKDAEACVQTKPHKEWSMFFRQRKRWASKWKHYKSKTPLMLALYVFSCNFSLIVAAIAWVPGLLSNTQLVQLLIIKCVPEVIFLGIVLKFLGKKHSTAFIPLTQLIYPFYVCFFGLIVQRPTYEWKGRKLV